MYISDEEREKCRKVVNAYTEELDDVDVMVVEAGRYGFLKLLYYRVPYGFDDAVTYTDSLTLFLIYGTNGLRLSCFGLPKTRL